VSSIIYGVDFTSAPSRSKAITVAQGEFTGRRLVIERVSRLESFTDFESFLQRPGAWTAGFDFPFGLPRALVQTLGWPQDWRALLSHVVAIGKDEFKRALDLVRQARPVGSKYIARKGDAQAGSSSPMKLVNPPVGLMFFEGASRLADAGVCVIPCAVNADCRVALEAYPGFLARQLTRQSYKKDGRDGNTTQRIATRTFIVKSLAAHVQTQYGFTVEIAAKLEQTCVEDGSGDTLDAVLCAVQAAVAQVAYDSGDMRYGIPVDADDFEGWIATVG
jgi:Protein of unknown function (DUF429)